MIWYHLYDKGEGIRAGFLCVADHFDDADAEASRAIARGEFTSRLWIITEKELRDLQDSINQVLPKE